MPTNEETAIVKRIDALLLTPPGGLHGEYEVTIEMFQSAVTIAQRLYGSVPESPQVQTIMKAAQQARAQQYNPAISFGSFVRPAVMGSLRAMKADIESGLVGTIERRATGQVLADLVATAKEAIVGGSPDMRNVAAVLTAAAFEDTIRRMGTSLANVQGRPKLSEVLDALRQAGVLVAAPATTAQGYLKFRNDALHADWGQMNDAVVQSCLAFTEGLILQHLS